jgi:UDP-3-O-[3-hydroxymyristoyl] glucosamine N-acyltransferase
MKFQHPISIKAIAERINAQIIGDNMLLATGINEIHKVEKGDITFVDVAKYFQKSLTSAASIIILNQVVECPKGKALLVCDHPFLAYNDLAKQFRKVEPILQNIDNQAIIHPSSIIEVNVTIGKNVIIGENSYIQAGVIIRDHTIIGDNVTIQSGSIIGTEAFYFKKHPDKYEKWHSCGRVIIENNVQIGAGCTINKGVSGDTIIGEGTKIDCQVHIGHGVVIGKNCLIAAQVGIAGKTIIEDDVVLYGQVGVGQNVRIGKKAIVLGQSGVTKDLEGGKTYFGTPAEESREVYKQMVALKRMINDK